MLPATFTPPTSADFDERGVMEHGGAIAIAAWLPVAAAQTPKPN